MPRDAVDESLVFPDKRAKLDRLPAFARISAYSISAFESRTFSFH